MDLSIPLRRDHCLDEVIPHTLTLIAFFIPVQISVGRGNLSFGDLCHADLFEIGFLQSKFHGD
jgi:hypothetical protein